MKKICFYILIFSFLNYVGCYSSRSINKEELYSQDLGEPAGVVTIITNDEKRIEVHEGIYEVIGDTLYASGINKANTTVYGQPINIKIALGDIRSVEIKEPDGWATTGLIIGVAGLAIIIAVISIGNSFDKSTKSCASEGFTFEERKD